MIRLENITKYYGNLKQRKIYALKNLTLRVPSRRITGVIGESGAGKSSLVRCVNLLERPDEGRVWVSGLELTSLSDYQLRAVRRGIGMISQSFHLMKYRNVYDNVALPLMLSQYSKQEINQKVIPLLEVTGLKEKADAYPSELSGGQKQRVGIARALVCQPKILLCDEITSALDPQATETILQLLRDLHQKLDLTILLITHEFEVIKAICDEVAILSKGMLIEQSDILKIFTQPKTQLAAQFVETALHYRLPKALQGKLYSEKKPNSHTILRFIFRGISITDFWIFYLIQQIGLRFNLLQTHLETIKGVSLGTLIIKTPDTPLAVQAGMDYLNTCGVGTEVVGYVD